MPDHTTWPPGARLVERVARAVGYAAAAAAGWTVLPSLLGVLAVTAGAGAVIATVGRWWHAEMVATAALAPAFLGYAVLAGDTGVAALCVVGAASTTRRAAELWVFSAKVRQARQERIAAWQRVISTLEEDT